MVTVRKQRHKTDTGELDIQAWVQSMAAKLDLYTKTDANEPSEKAEINTEQGLDRLYEACLLAAELEHKRGDQLTGWGDGYSSFKAGLDMADTLVELQLDIDTLTAAVLYRSVRENKVDSKTIASRFGDEIAMLIDGVRRMAAVSKGISHRPNEVLGQAAVEQSENIRRMLVAMVDDVRIALIKLAERTCAIRAVKHAPEEKRQRVAREISEVYAPLAQRLGIGQIKWELEDLSFRYLQPFDYKQIAAQLAETRLGRQDYIDDIISLLKQKLSDENISAEINGRAKHIYSIWKKMQRKRVGFTEIYDIRAVRILVDSVKECYAALGIVHSLWRNIPNEFDDYIANTKENGYQSLHTAVQGPEGKVIEVQIRTHSMHEAAEYGVCAHWMYKKAESENSGSAYDEKIEWLRQVLEWQDEISSNDESLTPDFAKQDRIYVFTPDGHVVDLPAGATPVDFAFRIHTDVGIRCRGAKVNGKIVPLNHTLETASQVEILTSKRDAPSRDWLNPVAGYITTTKARSRLQAWFKAQDFDKNLADGRSMLERELRRMGLTDVALPDVAKRVGIAELDDLYVAIATGDVSINRVISAAQRISGDGQEEDAPVISTVGRANILHDGTDVYIDGVGNLLTSIAQCCHPVPGESIAGYITLGRGVSIHSKSCGSFLNHQRNEPERIIEVDWAQEQSSVYSAQIVVEAYDRHGLLRDVSQVLNSQKVNVSAMNTLSNKNKSTVDMKFTIEVGDFGQLNAILTKIAQVPNVFSVRRDA